MKKYEHIAISSEVFSKTAETILPTSKLSEQERIKQNIVIMPELEQLIPPLSTEEFGQLESNILEHGCKDALMIWEMPTGDEDNEEYTYILIDGHNQLHTNIMPL